MNDEKILTEEPADEEYTPTPEDIERWERERREREEAKIQPYRDIAAAMRDRDELIAGMLEELILMEMGV